MYFIATTVPRPQLHSGVLKISWEEGQVPAVQENMAECENAFRTAIYGKTREGVPYSAFLECRRSLGSRRLRCSGFGLQHLWFCYRSLLFTLGEATLRVKVNSRFYGISRISVASPGGVRCGFFLRKNPRGSGGFALYQSEKWHRAVVSV